MARPGGLRHFLARPRVRSLTPELSKGLEFDPVVLVETGRAETGTGGIAGSPVGIGDAVDRHVAMTSATRQLVVLANTG